ncbi:cytochrome b/b6 domain-containing protein [Zavarzinia sp.]|uniref:cytochrome b/b6 domain-containing protein n=1 Tax=Zavarzinia sp. TaxID=2027920 RepID=UPI003566F297
MSDGTPREVTVWDPLVRLFHWSLVSAMAIVWLDEDGEILHRVAGYAALGLVGFRLIWGLIGPRHARFIDFLQPPGFALRYLIAEFQGRGRRYLGHNPAGGIMVVVLMALIAATAVTGWMSVTDAFFGDYSVIEAHKILSNVLLGCIGLHLAGVAFASLRHGENLVRAMVTGRKRG